MLTSELGFGPDDPVFPATRMGQDSERRFEPQGLTRKHWSDAAPIRQIYREAFVAADLSYLVPHSFRKTLVRLGQQICHTPEAWKAWSQNLGHDSEATTFVGYGNVPLHRQVELLRDLGKPRQAGTESLVIDALERLVKSVRERAA
jgi:integrase/recombinase XerD